MTCLTVIALLDLIKQKEDVVEWSMMSYEYLKTRAESAEIPLRNSAGS
jgi:hypothetical protein